jgi:hypothetical protein
MKKRRFSGILAGLIVILLQPAILVGLVLKAVFHFFRIVLDPHIARGDILYTLAKSLVIIGLLWVLFYGWHVYNELVDMEHFLDVAHGRMLAEMQRKEDVLSQCRKAVAAYANMEGKIHDRLIVLHQLTKAHGPGARIVKDEGLEIIKLISELDLLIERYPALKSKGPYGLLMETIRETGLRVISERINYNQWTYNYNVMRFLFPYKIVAWVCGFEEQPFLQGPLDYRALKKT